MVRGAAEAVAGAGRDVTAGGAGVGDVDGDVDGVADGLGGLEMLAEAAGGGAGRWDRAGEEGGVGDAGPGVLTCGTLCLTSWAARSRDGVWYESSPLANPAAATIAVPAPATDSRTARRALGRFGRGGSSFGCGAVVAGRAHAAEPPAGARPRAPSGCLPAGCKGGPVSPGSISTYGRIRSGPKSSAAAASAVRVSRRASAARSAQSQDGLRSGPLGAPHSGQLRPWDSLTRSPLPSRTTDTMRIFFASTAGNAGLNRP